MSTKLTHEPRWQSGYMTIPGIPQPIPAYFCSAVGHRPKADGTPHVIQAACNEGQYRNDEYRKALEDRVRALVEETR